MSDSKKITRGRRVAHAGLDSEKGTAKTGIVEDVIGDEESGLVVARWDGEDEAMAYDSREVVPLVYRSDFGPVLLYPRHLWAALKTPFGAVSIVLAIVIGAGLLYLRATEDWDSGQVLISGVILMALGLIVLSVAEMSLRRRARQTPDQS